MSGAYERDQAVRLDASACSGCDIRGSGVQINRDLLDERVHRRPLRASTGEVDPIARYERE